MDDERISKLVNDEAEVVVLDYGDAISETRQTAPVPRFSDSVYGFGIHPG